MYRYLELIKYVKMVFNVLGGGYMKWLNLKTLIIGIVVVTLAMTLLVNLWSAHRVNTDVLTYNTLETNRVYAEKLATTVDHYMDETFTTLEYSANYIANELDNEALLAAEAERLHKTNEMFNSVIIANKDSFVIGVSPSSLELKGTYLQTAGPIEAINKKVPLISKTYTGTTSRLLIFISHPIFSATGEYLGFIGGSIYIKEDNAFNAILGKHFYNDGSYVYVVDGEGRIIYHVNPARLNDVVADNPIVDKIMAGEQGAMQVKNSQGVEMLAGYSVVESAGWGIVSQRPVDVALAPVTKLLNSLWLGALPLLLVVLIVVVLLSIKVTSPLNQLAKLSTVSADEKILEDIKKIPASYYETKKLKDALIEIFSALLNQVKFFKQQSTSDPLTGLMNRRTMDDVLTRFSKEHTPYALAIVDLDHFKRINDEHGHATGDEVLKYFADKMRAHAPQEAYCCRYGGEEFVMIFPHFSAEQAFEVADLLRQDLENTISPCGRPVTSSGGVASVPTHAKASEQVMALADEALYAAKADGRNRIYIAK